MITARIMNRRQFVRFGTAGMLLGQGLERTSQAALGESAMKAGFGKARSVLMIFTHGGQSQIDMWDPKPDAPEHIRGAFQPIPTSVPGLYFTEHMPGIARAAHRFTVLRSMAHADLDHGSAVYLALTGRYHERLSSNPPPRPTDMPTLGSVLTSNPVRQSFPYQAVHVNGPALVPFEPSPGQYGGVLGSQHDPLVLGDVTEGPLAIPGLTSDTRLSNLRMAGRLNLKNQLDGVRLQLLADPVVRENTKFYQQAISLLSSRAVRNAFDLSREPARLRDRYGRHRSGQACLLGRKLVEAGVPFVNVIWNQSNRGQDRDPESTDVYGWDTHNDIFSSLKDRLIPRFDQTFPVLLEDLDDRGLLDETLVICMGEFGRAPTVAKEPSFAGNEPGRKHWANAYSIVLAGAGVGRGQVIGATDRNGGDVITERYGPWDVAATIFHALGIHYDGHYTDSLDRPYPLSVGKPITSIYS